MQISRAGISNREDGFTLLELSVAIFLVALFSFLVVPSVMMVGEDRMAVEARRLAGAVKYNYNEAALSGRRHRLQIDLDKGSYGFAEFVPKGDRLELTPTGNRRNLPDDVRFRDVTVAGRGLHSQGEIEVDIFPVGWMEETTIHLEQEDDNVLTLHIVPLTGIVEVYEGYQEI